MLQHFDFMHRFSLRLGTLLMYGRMYVQTQIHLHDEEL